MLMGSLIIVLFNSYEFLFLFLPVAVIVYYALKDRQKSCLWLVTLSLFFYAWWEYKCLLILLTSIIFNYCVGYYLIYEKESKYRKKIFVLGIVGNLLALTYYKYFDFLLANFNILTNADFQLWNIVLPIGISFFTFTQIAFLVDAYQKKVNKCSIIEYLLFVTYFPHLIAGPILHHHEMIPQFLDEKNIKLNWKNVYIGFSIFSIGLFKKVAIADQLAPIANVIFSSASQGMHIYFFEAWIGALAYTLQLYFDFSGYSEMAIGISLMFNIKLPINFYSPYQATSIIDFWRRWHITLSRYLKDYLYIPLGGNRSGDLLKMRNLMITMLIGGLWHGASWNFVVWGGVHGSYLVINHIWRFFKIRLPKILSWGITFSSIVFAWVFFRASDMKSAWNIIYAMVGINGFSLPFFMKDFFSGFLSENFIFLGFTPIANVSKIEVVVFIFAFMTVLYVPNIVKMMYRYNVFMETRESNDVACFQWRMSSVCLAALIGMLAVSILLLSGKSEFLYFQF